MPHAVSDFSACGAGEVVSRSISFAPALAAGETISAPTCSITVATGTDAAAQSRLVSGPTVTGSTVAILFGNGVSGVTYQVLITVTTSAGQTLECYAQQPVIAQ